MKVSDLAKAKLPSGWQLVKIIDGKWLIRRKPKKPLNMGEIKITGENIQWPHNDEATAGIIGSDWNTIWLNPHRKKELWAETEESIELSIMHENIHQVIGYLEGENVSDSFDRLFELKGKPYLETAIAKINFCREICER